MGCSNSKKAPEVATPAAKPEEKPAPKPEASKPDATPKRADSVPKITDRYLEKHQNGVREMRINRTTAIAEIYDIDHDSCLGEGINGKVLSCTKKSNGHEYALKPLSRSNFAAKRASLLYNEVEIYLQLDHPNVCRLIEVFEDEKFVYLVMEICKGKELHDRLADCKRFSERDAAHIVFQMFDAVGYCHSHSIVHRDLKLENWVYDTMDDNSNLKLIDFGFSKIYSGDAPMTAIRGTVFYVAPEVLAGAYDAKCDVWSLGVITYMIVQGSPPFVGRNFDEGETLHAIKTEEKQFDCAFWKSRSPDLIDFIRRCLVKDPQDRWSASEAIKHKWLSGEWDIAHGDFEIDKTVFKDLRRFARMGAFNRAVLGLMAYQLSSDELQGMESTFKHIDHEGRGAICMDDLSKELKKKLHLKDAQVQKIFRGIDQSGLQEICYSEFVAAAMQAKLLQEECKIREAFQHFDLNNTGIITEEALRQVLGDRVSENDIQQIIRDLDYKNQGGIDYEEFLAALKANQHERDSDTISLASTNITGDFGVAPPAGVPKKLSNRNLNVTMLGGAAGRNLEFRNVLDDDDL
mmetsp:Transcript_3054/g.7315  ORF Transcript_3054/g.7315 Transcript_3054/m.7315 type:complete len:575 (-) Transcript_3054:324-2048(-)